MGELVVALLDAQATLRRGVFARWGVAHDGAQGTVNLLKLSGGTGMAGSGESVCGAVLGRCGRAGDLVPGGESVGHFASVFLGAKSMAARSEVW